MSSDTTPAIVVYSHKGRTFKSHTGTVAGQRLWAKASMKNQRAHPDRLARPMCIVRLKALK